MQYDTILLDELSPDSSDFEHDGLVLAQNALPVQSAWREVKGRRLLALAPLIPGEIPLAAFSAFQKPSGGGDPLGYAATTRNLYGYNAGWFNMSKGGGPYVTCSNWSLTKFGSSVIAASNSFGVPLQVRVPGAATFADLVTSVDRPAPSCLTVVRSVVMGANLLNGGAGVYAGVNDGQQFAWSARNDAANWQVDGTNGAGFAFLKGPAGPINAVVGYPGFALAFQAFAVTRLDYTGDANGFQPSEIGVGGLGIPSLSWGGGAIKAGSDVFYYGELGPCVVYNGETCQILGGSKVRRFLSDMLSDYGADTGASIHGSYDPWAGAVLWVVRPKKGVAADIRIIVVAEIKHGSYDAYTVRFSPQEGRWSTIEPGLSTRAAFHDLSGTAPLFPLSNLYMVEYDVIANTMLLTAFQDQTSSLPITFRTKIWHPADASSARRAALCGVRPVWRADLNGDGKPALAITVYASNDPATLNPGGPGVFTVNLTADKQDDNGFYSTADLPLVGGFFQFDVTIPSMANATLHELRAIEVAFQSSAEDF